MIEKADILRTDQFSITYKNTVNIEFQHYHDSYEMCFFVSANMNIFLKNNKYEIHNGDLIFINEYDIHHFFGPNMNLPYSRYILNFKKNFIQPSLKAAGIEGILDQLRDFNYTHAATTLKERNELDVLFKSLLQSSSVNPDTLPANFKDAEIKAKLLQLLIRVWELLHKNKPEQKMSKKSIMVQKFIQFIDENYMNEISLDLLEAEFYTDKFHISHIFKETAGFTVMEYLQHRRVIEAQKMLKDTTNEITDISFDCGFNNIQHFYRVFKKISGVTPSNYRKKNKIQQ